MTNRLAKWLRKYAVVTCAWMLGASALASEVQHHSFYSTTLHRDYVFNIYLPDDYQNSGLSYPVLYLLHGNLGTEQSWVENGNIPQTADQLIAARKIPARSYRASQIRWGS